MGEFFEDGNIHTEKGFVGRIHKFLESDVQIFGIHATRHAEAYGVNNDIDATEVEFMLKYAENIRKQCDYFIGIYGPVPERLREEVRKKKEADDKMFTDCLAREAERKANKKDQT